MGLICCNPQNRNVLALIILTVLVVQSEHVTKREGEEVVLHVNKPNTLTNYIWTYGQKAPIELIAVVTENFQTVVNGTRFGTRLHLNMSTANLTVQNLTIEDSGVFKIQILTQNGTLEVQFSLTVIGNTIRRPVLEWTNVTLQTGTTYLDPEYSIFWTKNDFSGKLIARRKDNIITYDPELQEHLLLDPPTGDLTITNILKHHSGVYCVRVMYHKDEHSSMIYDVHVYSAVSAPLLSFELNRPESEEPWSCRVNCSVQNSEEVVLKWLRVDNILNQTSDSVTLIFSLVLPLNVPQTKEEVIYTCQAENPVSNQTVSFNTTYSCPQKTKKGPLWPIGVAVITVLGLLGLGLYKMCKRYKMDSIRLTEVQEQDHASTPLVSSPANHSSLLPHLNFPEADLLQPIPATQFVPNNSTPPSQPISVSSRHKTPTGGSRPAGPCED